MERTFKTYNSIIFTHNRAETADKILKAIKDFWLTKGYAPGARDIQKAIGVESLSTVARHLKYLRADGKVIWNEGDVRSLRLPNMRIVFD